MGNLNIGSDITCEKSFIYWWHDWALGGEQYFPLKHVHRQELRENQRSNFRKGYQIKHTNIRAILNKIILEAVL